MNEIKTLTDFSYMLRQWDRLRKIERQLHRLAEMYCNYGLTPRQEKREEKLFIEAQTIASELGLKAHHQGDPRGGSLVITEPTEKEYYNAKEYIYV